MNEPSATKPSSLRAGLVADHARLERLFDDLIAALSADARQEVNRLWTELDTGLTRHMDLEEKSLFPALAGAHPSELAELRAEHVRIRTLLAELGVGVDLHVVNAETVSQFESALKAHARREDELIYRLADTALERTARQRLRDHLSLLMAAAAPTHHTKSPARKEVGK